MRQRTPYPVAMARRTNARHARPTGRGALVAAYALLESDVARLRSSNYADHLELIRLSALVEGLLANLNRLGEELSEMRRDLHNARSVPAVRSAEVEALALEVTGLRATLAMQQVSLTALTSQLAEVVSRLEQATVAPPSQAFASEVAEAPMTSSAVTWASVPAAPVSPAPVPPAPVPATPVPATPVPPEVPPEVATVPEPTPAFVSAPAQAFDPAVAAGARQVPVWMGGSSPSVDELSSPLGSGWRVDVTSFPSSAPDPDEEAKLDDETVLRLRLIRESFRR